MAQPEQTENQTGEPQDGSLESRLAELLRRFWQPRTLLVEAQKPEKPLEPPSPPSSLSE